MRYRFGISIALNLFLLTTIVAARVDASREFTPATPSPFQEPRFGDLPASDEPLSGVGDLEARLKTAGFRGSDIKPMILGWLNSAEQGSGLPGLVSPAGTRFWQAAYRPGLSSARWLVGHQGWIRDSLLGHFGTEAAIDPAFASVFRPLGPDYDFLSSEAQIELQANQLRLLEAAVPPNASTSGEMHCAVPSGAAPRAGSASVPTGLSASEEREYRLRFSPLAQQLRVSVSSRDEHQFRLLFDWLVRLEQSESPEDQAEIRRQLRAEMGDSAFDRFWSGRDPSYAALETFLRGRNLAAQQIMAAYAIVNQAQERLLIAIADQRGQGSVLTDVQRIRADQSAGLTRLLGEEVAAGLTAAMTRAAISLSRSNQTRC